MTKAHDRTRLRGRMFATVCLAGALLATGAAAGKWDFKPTANERRALASISPAALQAHVSFLAADALAGRAAGTQGLEVAAEYIAAQFRSARLKAVGGDDYFQTTPRLRLAPASVGYRCAFAVDGRTVEVPASQFGLISIFGTQSPVVRDLDVNELPVYKVPFGDALPDRIPDAGRTAVITESPSPPADRAQLSEWFGRLGRFEYQLAALGPALVIDVRRDEGRAIDYFGASVLVDPANRRQAVAPRPIVTVVGKNGAEIYDALPPGPTRARFTAHLNAPVEKDAPQRNVIGVLPGSDRGLADTYVLVTAHYDGQGTRPASDPVWNSANDNGSGTAAVMALASALSSLERRPRRSIAFIAFHGEESGLVGSRFYAQHPVIPVARTVADINIEMVGRTDDTEGDQHKRASVTGFDYSDVGQIFQRAGALTGITVFKHPKNSDPYFARSDNQALASLGVPAHTVCVTFQYPDYHGAADTWQKIDYDNMARTVRMIGTAVVGIADAREEPRWNPAVTRANVYLEAWRKQHGGTGQ